MFPSPPKTLNLKALYNPYLLRRVAPMGTGCHQPLTWSPEGPRLRRTGSKAFAGQGLGKTIFELDSFKSFDPSSACDRIAVLGRPVDAFRKIIMFVCACDE